MPLTVDIAIAVYIVINAKIAFKAKRFVPTTWNYVVLTLGMIYVLYDLLK